MSDDQLGEANEIGLSPEKKYPSKKARSKQGLKPVLDFLVRLSGGVVEEEKIDSAIVNSRTQILMDQARAFQTIKVFDVMVPRIDIVAIDVDLSLKEVLALCVSSEHSRLPVYEETLDQYLGIIHIKDVLKTILEALEKGPIDWQQKPLRSMIREVLHIPKNMPAGELLNQMQAKRIHMGLVIDEFGGTEGLVTLEDLIESVVGEIEDEHDDEPEISLLKPIDNGFEASGRIGLSQLEEETNVRWELDEDEGGVETLGGLLSKSFGYVPRLGDVFSHPHNHWRVEVIGADQRHVQRVILRAPNLKSVK
jgi:CBS domain containing-hemolysin-like protein